MTTEKIWCLFSINNNYDQPENNLCAWWKDKPGFEALASAMGLVFKGDSNILAVVKVHQGEEVRLDPGQGTDYRLVEVKEGQHL